MFPFYTFQDFQISDRAQIRVNVANGNMLFAATDLSIAGPGQALQLDRYYNSFTGSATTSGSFALGWGSSLAPYDVGLRIETNSISAHLPGGTSAVFAKNGVTWTPPEGLNATLVEDASSSLTRYVFMYNRTGERMTFDTSGFLRGHTDRNGVGLSIDANGTLQAATHTASGRNLQVTYGFGELIEQVSDSSGRTLNYSHTENGYLASSPDGMTYGYQGSGLLNSVVLSGVTYAISYDSSKRATSITVKKSGEPDKTTAFSYNAGSTVVTDPDGRRATYTYDHMGRVTATKDGLNRERSQQWTANSDISQTTDAIGSGTTTYTYDPSGNRTGITLPTGAASSALYATGVNCSAPNTGTAFQPKCTTDDAGNKKQYQYDTAGNLTKQSDTTTTTAATEFENTYGTCGAKAGQVCTTKDGNGNTTTYSYSAAGDLTKVTPPAPQGATSYTYDSAGRVRTVTDGNGDVTSYQYDFFDRIVTTTFDDGSTVRSSYNLSGTQRSRTDSAGGTASYEYNSQNRMTKQTGPTSGVTHDYTYDRVGNILTFTDAHGTVRYTYDAANQLVRLQEPGGSCPTSGTPAANSGCVTFAYDDNAAEISRTTPGGAVTTTTRDTSGRPTRITAKTGTGATAVDIGYSYTPSGSSGDRVNVQTRTAFAEQGVPAGAVTSYTYDSRNRLTLASERNGTATNASWAYSYDGNANRTRQVRSGNTGATAGTINYTYDAANRLTGATGQAATWTYDGAGNQTRNGSRNLASTYGVRGETLTTGSLTADYFGLGNTDRLAAGSRTFTSGTLGIATATSGDNTQTYTHTPDGKSVGFKGQSRWYYVHDHLGSVVGIMSAGGAYGGGYSYSPYGEARATGTASAVTINPLRYISGFHDGSGIYKLGARYYDTSLGRFTQMDPSGQERNPYAYASCNPVNAKDPGGLDAGSVTCGYVGLAIGTIFGVGFGLAPISAGASVLIGGIFSVVIGIASIYACE
ncbi:RHS repeat-associated core domain-containing protein [Microbacterium sp. HMH0099]|uniref:RHS repeat-associated core domain-containing protein n=1 Tax=Microbacterium sp. HMH0099 TaxID=3414026 RepID=UPI003BF65C1F